MENKKGKEKKTLASNKYGTVPYPNICPPQRRTGTCTVALVLLLPSLPKEKEEEKRINNCTFSFMFESGALAFFFPSFILAGLVEEVVRICIVAWYFYTAITGRVHTMHWWLLYWRISVLELEGWKLPYWVPPCLREVAVGQKFSTLLPG